MLTEHLNENTVLFAEDVPSWQDAIELACGPLIANGSIKQSYVDAIVESVAAGGTYIDLGHGVALPHHRPESGVLKTGLSALRVRPDVLLNDDEKHPIKLFICLAAADSKKHLETLAALGRLLSNPEARESLLATTNTADFLAVLNAGEKE